MTLTENDILTTNARYLSQLLAAVVSILISKHEDGKISFTQKELTEALALNVVYIEDTESYELETVNEPT